MRATDDLHEPMEGVNLQTVRRMRLPDLTFVFSVSVYNNSPKSTSFECNTCIVAICVAFSILDFKFHYRLIDHVHYSETSYIAVSFGKAVDYKAPCAAAAYVAILTFAAKVQSICDRSPAVLIWKSISGNNLSDLRNSIDQAEYYLGQWLEIVDRREQRGRGVQLLEKADEMLTNIDKAMDSLNELNSKMVLAELKVAEEAHYNAYTGEEYQECLEETRIELLKDIQSWASYSSCHSDLGCLLPPDRHALCIKELKESCDHDAALRGRSSTGRNALFSGDPASEEPWPAKVGDERADAGERDRSGSRLSVLSSWDASDLSTLL
ncbi:hypothetical protein N7540_012992 [Penicillium herquei]|nr:hypothetical protein N7540_012992 [Penicillium herquei]